ncbi:Uncharacterized protein OS=Bradyrhizobium japonicum USDA 6 GN=BJ6T_21760 PE=4 SV=1: DUF4239 [Gemmataceae bacterium]|nr:Uncharacterized protein OS=Bradyrhizobium japonicum USDA 6 GN=BJ6T_21760 PE=4 SV=1: DUF4239 [Gemmataceae bacterium]VTU01074.1 Uncharacterized protein OS=Bradyrhizobium japonicum USDA 6 GN=BJ6T_21760 PE=4 SV=1: DUF4239 [Gemmataceae bacterium]
MNSLAASAAVFACVLAGAGLGVLVRRRLPSHHLCPESRDVVKLGLGLIATLTALVLGLLIATAKGTFDAQNSAIKEFATKSILLDRALALYGPDAAPARGVLHESLAHTTRRIWADDGGRPSAPDPGDAGHTLEGLYSRVADLSPRTEAQRALKARAVDVTTDLAHARLRIFAQQDGTMPVMFFVVLVCWLMLLFAGFGILAPAHGTVAAVLGLCALSVAGAIFLTLELNTPFSGTILVSDAPLTDALGVVGT